MEHGLKAVDLDTVENDDPIGGFNQLSLSQDAENVTVLGNGPRDSVKFEWMITPWSECSQTCSKEPGYKVNDFENENSLKGMLFQPKKNILQFIVYANWWF